MLAGFRLFAKAVLRGETVSSDSHTTIKRLKGNRERAQEHLRSRTLYDSLSEVRAQPNMDAGESGAFIEDFGDSLNDEDDPGQAKNGLNAMEGLDTSLQAPNANDFSNARLIEEARI